MEFNRIAGYFYLSNSLTKVIIFVNYTALGKLFLKGGFSQIPVIRA